MDGRNHDDTKSGHGRTELTSDADTSADSGLGGLHDKLAADSLIPAGASVKATALDQHLPSVALWQEGLPSGTSSDIGPGFGWSARYAENFDREEPQHLDLAPLLGLPLGTDHENLVLAAKQQEDDLLSDLLK